ncbi:MAG: putative ATP-dependent ligase [Acidimicrobiales bacterium]|nr:putative ATP-dependent ligase [Acidimicrobiales bacterium]
MSWPLSPMKATSGALPRGADWRYEPKWDGHRVIVRMHRGTVDAISSSGQNRIDRWPWLATAVAASCAGDVILDGEVIALDDDGRHSFQLVGRSDRPHAFVVFDILGVGGNDLLGRPWSERRDLLAEHVHPLPPLSITPVSDDADAMLSATKANGFEGVIAKRIDSIYLAGRRTSSWIKVKHRFEQELVIGGYLLGEGNRATSFGSILVGYHDPPGGPLRFGGAVGTGFNEVTLRALQRQFAELTTSDCPFDPVPKLPRGRAMWLTPTLVAQVSFAEWTEAGHLRHPVYQGLREDKSPEDVVREV